MSCDEETLALIDAASDALHKLRMEGKHMGNELVKDVALTINTLDAALLGTTAMGVGLHDINGCEHQYHQPT